jgi:Zn-finger nucleic acid-binding protein
MFVLEIDQVEIDYCTACRGIWLDSGELELLLEDAAEAEHVLRSFRQAQTDEKKRKCPICLVKMDKVHVGQTDDQMELIDRCPKNHGLWFDKGELQRVLQSGRFDEKGKIKRLLGDLFIDDGDR